MVQLILRAKHWQLFILTFVIPVIVQFTFMGILIYQMINSISELQDEAMASNNPFQPFKMMGNILYFPIVIILLSSIYYVWIWSIAIGLQNKLPEHLQMKTIKFKIFFFFPLISLLLMSYIFFHLFSSIDMKFFESNPFYIVKLFLIIFPLQLFNVFCIVYINYFAAKTLKSIELRRHAIFSEYIGEFFLIWFYPIGVWILQPKINRMIE
jgi:hypothetical protein